MNKKEKQYRCVKFFEELCGLLEGRYERLSGCNWGISECLCPIGTTEEVTYYGKPEMSFRVSNHWNWYANTNRCSDPGHAQCYSTDFPWVRRRPAEGKPSRPIMAEAVCLYKNGKYHVVYGEYFDRKTKHWSWIESTPLEVLELL